MDGSQRDLSSSLKGRRCWTIEAVDLAPNPFPCSQAWETVGQLFCQPLATWPGPIHFPVGTELEDQPLPHPQDSDGLQISVC